jgi:hypothetical protein
MSSSSSSAGSRKGTRSQKERSPKLVAALKELQTIENLDPDPAYILANPHLPLPVPTDAAYSFHHRVTEFIAASDDTYDGMNPDEMRLPELSWVRQLKPQLPTPHR